MSADEPRTYVVGLPVVVTITPEGFVSVEVDTAEIAPAMAEGNDTWNEYPDEQVRADQATAVAWSKRHSVRAEGFAR